MFTEHPYVTSVVAGVIVLAVVLALLRYFIGHDRLATFLGEVANAGGHPATMFVGIAFAALVFIFYLLGAPDGKFLASLERTETARGLITFLVVLVTVVIAIILTLYPITSSETTYKDRFGLGKEVFTTLIGVLGTIVGFYFGSAERPAARVEVAEVKIADSQLLAHVSGGVAPYRYTIRANAKPIAENKVSNDGWIIETLSERPTKGTPIIVEVTDSKDQKATRKDVVSEETPPKSPESVAPSSPAPTTPAPKPADKK